MLNLALPVILTYLGLMLMGVVDIIFVGRVGASTIGAVGLGTSLFSWVFVFGIGLLAGLDYLVSFAQGSGRPEEGYRALVQGILVSTGISVPLTALLIGMAFRLEWLGVNPEVLPEARAYLRILALGLWPALVFNACRQYLTALGVALPALIILFAVNLLNAALNYVLIFGHYGAPRLGVAGSAISTTLSRITMMSAMIGCVWFWDRRHGRFLARIPFRLERESLTRFLRLGLPSAFQMTFEVGVFALSTTLAARLAAQALAAHQIVLNIASLTFMVPLGISSATAVLVGQSLGHGDRAHALKQGWTGLGLGAGFMAFSGLALFTFSGSILQIFTPDGTVREIATQIILIVALFQLSDGVQVVAAGALRGMGDTRSAMLSNLFGHWAIGLPIGLALCFPLGWGLVGLWTGLSLGLTTVAGLLLWAWRRKGCATTGG